MMESLIPSDVTVEGKIDDIRMRKNLTIRFTASMLKDPSLNFTLKLRSYVILSFTKLVSTGAATGFIRKDPGT